MFRITGCSESYLDVESTTNVTTENYYKTIDDADRALIGCYDGWQCTTSNGSLSIYVASQVMSDECFEEPEIPMAKAIRLSTALIYQSLLPMLIYLMAPGMIIMQAFSAAIHCCRSSTRLIGKAMIRFVKG